MIQLTAPALREIWPKAPQGVIDAFCSPEGQRALDVAGITATRTRLSVALSQVEHETNGFSIKDLTENINYSAERAAQIWPSRFPPVRNGVGSPDTVRRKYGTAPGWQLKMFDDVYGGRMGNRPGTSDGSKYIGHGGPQVTGLDGHKNVGQRMDPPVDLVADPKQACRHDLQPQILAGFWIWKNLNPVVDVGGLRAATKPWNGGYIGMADREAKMAGNDPIVARLEKAARTADAAGKLPGTPPTPKPPKDVVDEATKKERAARKTGGGLGGGGLANEGAKTGTIQEQTKIEAPLPSPMAWGLVGLGAVIVVVATIIFVQKKRKVIANWF